MAPTEKKDARREVSAGDPRTYAEENVPKREGGQARSREPDPSHREMERRRREEG